MRRKLSKWLHTLADWVGGLDYQAERENDAEVFKLLRNLKRGADRDFAEGEAEADRRNAEGLLHARAPDFCASQSSYLRQTYRVVDANDDAEGHFAGGNAHPDAKCPHCKKPLLLFWDINCRDPRIKQEVPEMFGELTRLPLYHCCRRPEPTSYQVLPDGGIKVFKPKLQAYEESPFGDFPSAFPRRPVRLEPIPRPIENLLQLAGDNGKYSLNDAELAQVAQYFGVSEEDSYMFNLKPSQFGGRPNCMADLEGIPCANRECPTHRMGLPRLRNESNYQMKELAAIGDDAGFAMSWQSYQIAFHICWKCFTVHARYQS